MKMELYDKLAILVVLLTGSAKIVLASMIDPLGVKYSGVTGYLFLGAYIAGYPVAQTYSSHTAFLYPYLISILFRLGSDVRAILILNEISNIITGGLVYLLASKMYGKKIGFISMGLMSLNWYYWWYSSSILPDGSSVTLMTAAVLFFYLGFEKGRNYGYLLTLPMITMSFLMRYTPLFMLIVFAIYLLKTKNFKWIKNKHFYAGLLCTLLILIAWGIYSIKILGAPFMFQPIVGAYGEIKVGGINMVYVISNLIRYLAYMPIIFSVFCGFFGLIGALIAIRRRTKEDFLLILWIVTFILILSFGASRWNDNWILMWIVPWGILCSIGLAAIKKRAYSTILVATALILSYIPYAIVPFASLVTKPSLHIQVGSMLLAHDRILWGAEIPMTGPLADLAQVYAVITSSKLTEPKFLIEDTIVILSLLSPLLIFILLKLLQKSNLLKQFLKFLFKLH